MTSCTGEQRQSGAALRPAWNKGSSFTSDELERLHLRGLFPCASEGRGLPLEVKVGNAMEQFREKSTALEKYIYLHTLQDVDETLYHACVYHYLMELMPFIYTPTVGEACVKWSRIYRQSIRGVYINLHDRGQIFDILRNYPEKNIEAIVVTDGEAILGLGDLGVNGMGIPIGKLALYTGCAGIHPSKCLPVHIDVGTNNSSLLKDPTYLGAKHARVRGDQFYLLMNEFIFSCKRAYGEQVLIQFEDFGNLTAFPLLDQHRESTCCFNDDVQGTAAVVLGGLMSAVPLTENPKVSDHTFIFYGAGAAGVGIADLISIAITKDRPDLTLAEARRQIWLVDSKGLVCSDRSFANDKHKIPYAHTVPTGCFDRKSLVSIVKRIRPTVLIGVSARTGAFSEAVCRAMAEINRRPVIFALSNPTTLCECTPQDAYAWTNGKCIYSSGSPFGDVSLPSGEYFKPGQGNNAYIFPGVGLGAIISGATSITDDDFYLAAQSLAEQVSADELSMGSVYPGLTRLREVSVAIAVAVAENMFHTHRSTKTLPLSHSQRYRNGDRALLDSLCRESMYTPSYDNPSDKLHAHNNCDKPAFVLSRL